MLSLGARGSIGDTLTFQKRGRLTIARQKPTPTDPKTDLQLAQRQVYREAVTAWNALTPEEKEAYRGVYPGLTPYQCYMKTALIPPEPEPPPEEYTEEQILYNNNRYLYLGLVTRHCQKLTIPNRTVTKLAFPLFKFGAPSGDVTLAIRKVSDDSLISSKVWGDAADLPTEYAWEEITLVTPQTIDEQVRIYAEFTGGDDSNFVAVGYQNENVKDDENMGYYHLGAWSENATYDSAYRYKYYEVE